MMLMTSKLFASSIRSCIDISYELGILYQAGLSESLDASKQFKRSARLSKRYRELYDVAVSMQDFNLMLHDKSFFQFTEEKEGEEIRLAYYPYAYSSAEYFDAKSEYDEFLNLGDLSQDEYEQYISELEFNLDIPVVRYDLSLRQYCDQYHPAGHFHIGFFAENRWPVKKILTPLAFFLKILFHYYPGKWKEFESDGHGLLEKYCDAVSKCKSLNKDYFSVVESKKLYFT